MIEIKAKSCGDCGDSCDLDYSLKHYSAAPVLKEFIIGIYIQECYSTVSICFNYKNNKWEYYEQEENENSRPIFYSKNLFRLIQRLKKRNRFSSIYPVIPTGLAITILLSILVRRSGRED